MFQRSIMVLAIGVLTTAATAQAQFAGNTAADTTREGLAGVWGEACEVGRPTVRKNLAA